MWRRSGLLGIFVSLALLVSLAVPVAAAPIPHSFYGTLTIGSSPALPGTELTAVVEGGGGSYTTTVAGQYGSATDPFDKLVVSGDDIEGGALIKFYVDSVEADQTADFHQGRVSNLNLTFLAAETFTITATAGAGGSILPTGAVVVESGADQAFTITPDTGYVIDDVLVDDGSVGAVTSYLFENVTADHTIHATFAFVIETFTITATAGEGGSISPAGDAVVESGADQAFTITADPGYDVADVLVDDVSVGAVESYLFENVTADHTIHASFVFVVETFTITATAGEGGSISPAGDVVVESGADQAFTITPDTGYDVANVLVDDAFVGAVESYLFENVTADHTIHASFAAVETFTITATASEGGAIEPSGEVVVNSGASQAFTITPDTGYVVDDVLVDGGSVGAVLSYTFENVIANHTIHASFAEVEAFTTILSADWNLLSTPIKLAADSDAVEQIFNTTSLENIEILYHWDAVGEKWDPILAGYELLPLYAIYVKVKPDASAMAVFIPCGVLSWPPSRDLEPGLNLIGPAPAFVDGNFEVMPLNQALISIAEAEGGLTGYIMVISPEHNQPGWAYALGGETHDLLPYQGYWVVVVNAVTLYGFSTTPVYP